jgi:hypothetical protein
VLEHLFKKWRWPNWVGVICTVVVIVSPVA